MSPASRKSRREIESLRRKIEVNPNQVQNYFCLADCLQEERRYDEAKSVFLALLRQEPDREQAREAFLGLADIFLTQGDVRQARSYWDEAVAATEDADSDPVLHEFHGCILRVEYHLTGVSEGDDTLLDRAIQTLERAACLDPDEQLLAAIHADLGLAYYEKGLPDLAYEHFNKALVLQPENRELRASCCFGLSGIELWDRENPEKAIYWTQRALDTTALQPPSNWLSQAYWLLACAFGMAGDAGRAVDSAQKSLQVVNPQEYDYQGVLRNAHYALARAYSDVEGKQDSAIHHYHQAAALDDDPWTYHLLGELYLEKDEHDLALAMLKAAVWLDPEYSRLGDVYNAIGVCFGKMKEHELALAYFEKAREEQSTISFKPCELYSNIGIIYWRLNQFDEAAQAFKTALGLMHPKDEGYQRMERHLRAVLLLAHYRIMRSTSQPGIALPESLSTPRPNGSRALERAAVEVESAWLAGPGVEVQSHDFTLRPYSMELLGLWLLLGGLLLPLAALLRWGWLGLVLALLTVAVPLLEVRFLRPTVTALVRRPARNLVVRFSPARPRREVLLCAHLDSKTELLDHYQRRALVRLSLPAIALVLISGILIALGHLLPRGTAAQVLYWLAFLSALPGTAYGLGMGANLVGGRFSPRPSSGAVDNGAAVTVLLEIANRLQRGSLSLDATAVTLLFTVGEEAQMQGALAYVDDMQAQDPAGASLPTCVVNLEVLGQSGGYLLWEHDGTAMISLPNDAALNAALARAVEAVTGEPPIRAPQLNSDAFAFLQAGIPATTLGSYDRDLGGRGLHSALDSASRVDPARLVETAEVLCHLLEELDTGGSGVAIEAPSPPEDRYEVLREMGNKPTMNRMNEDD